MTDSHIEFDMCYLNHKLLKKYAWSAHKPEIYLNSKMVSEIHKNQIQVGNIDHFKESIKENCWQAQVNFDVSSRSMVPQNIWYRKITIDLLFTGFPYIMPEYQVSVWSTWYLQFWQTLGLWTKILFLFFPHRHAH